jgi:hypothetical protein
MLWTAPPLRHVTATKVGAVEAPTLGGASHGSLDNPGLFGTMVLKRGDSGPLTGILNGQNTPVGELQWSRNAPNGAFMFCVSQ